MPNATIDKTSATTKGGTHLNSNNYSTSYTRSTPAKANRTEGTIAKKEIWTITPEKAQKLIDTNPSDNRYIRPSKVAQMTHDMISGNWKIDGHEVSLSPDGKLIDGQHRMMAVVNSGLTIDFWMALDVPETTQFDIGAPRSSTDSLRIGRMLNNPYLATNRVVSLTNAFFRALYGVHKSMEMTNNDRAEFINENEDAIFFVTGIMGANGELMNRGAVSAACVAAVKCGVPRNELETFAEEVNSGVIYDRSHSSAAVLRTMLIESKFGNGGSQAQAFITSVTCQAIADHYAGKERKKKYQNTKSPYFEELKRREGIA